MSQTARPPVILSRDSRNARCIGCDCRSLANRGFTYPSASTLLEWPRAISETQPEYLAD